MIIFGIVTVVVGQLDRLQDAPQRAVTSQGRTVRIERDADGHYWAQAQINGAERRMLIDSGATTTALSVATAKAAGVDVEESTFPRLIDTANGQIVARTAHVERLTIGSIEVRDLPVVVAAELGNQDLLGMNFLSRLGGWRVEGRTLILTSRTGT